MPSLLGETLGREIRAQLLCLARIRKPPILMPPDRSPPPELEHPEPVPQKYRFLVGNHEAHPGTGLGNAARTRRPTDSRQLTLNVRERRARYASRR